MNKTAGKSLGYGLVIILGVGVLIQWIPYGRNHENPLLVREPRWGSAHVRELAQRACFDCHSNETRWPWYSEIAPVSWWIRHAVDEGRSEVNFSDWRGNDRKREGGGKIKTMTAKIGKEVMKGKMPPLLYRLGHPESRLSEAEKEELIQGMASPDGK